MAKGDWFYNEDIGDMDREDEEPGCGTKWVCRDCSRHTLSFFYSFLSGLEEPTETDGWSTEETQVGAYNCPLSSIE